MLKKVISGGQTGVDRAGLDAAALLGFALGGWCPRGRRAEDGRVPDQYPLVEMDTDDYKVRTEKNVVESDATLIIKQGWKTPGTSYTISTAQKHGKPCRVIDIKDGCDYISMADWLRNNRVVTLNVAGPRESTRPGIYARARDIMHNILIHYQAEV